MNRFVFECIMGPEAEREVIKAGLGPALQASKSEVLGRPEEHQKGDAISFSFGLDRGPVIERVGQNFAWADPVGTADTVFVRASGFACPRDKDIAMMATGVFMDALSRMLGKEASPPTQLVVESEVGG